MCGNGKRVLLAGVAAAALFAGGAARAAEGEHPAVQDLTERGVLKGYPQGKFEPNRVVTRLELAVILSRLLRAIENNPAASQQPDAPKKAPKASPLPSGVPQWARAEFTYLAQRGYPEALPQLCRELRQPVRQGDLTAALTWGLSSLAARGYIPPGDLLPAPPEPKQ